MSKDSNEKYITKTTLNEAVDAILNGMNNMVEGLESKINTRFDGVENQLAEVKDHLKRAEVELAYVKDEVDGIKADLSYPHFVIGIFVKLHHVSNALTGIYNLSHLV